MPTPLAHKFDLFGQYLRFSIQIITLIHHFMTKLLYLVGVLGRFSEDALAQCNVIYDYPFEV